MWTPRLHPFGGPAISAGHLPERTVPRPFPNVSRMNGVQIEAMRRIRAAPRPSENATAALLQVLESAGMRASLRRCCPQLVGWSALELLDELRANVESAELVHNFDGSWEEDATIEIGLVPSATYFPSTWQLRYLG